MSNDDHFEIRVRAAGPSLLALPTSEKGKKRGGQGKACKNNAAQPQQQHLTHTVCPSTSLEQLSSDIFKLFNVTSESYQISFFAGYPMTKQLKHQEGKSTVHELGIKPKETLLVKFELVSDAASGVKGNAAAVPNSRPKRRAATEANAKMKDGIAAKEKESSKKKASKASSIAAKGSTATVASKKQKKAKMEGPGYRLSDGKVVAGPRSKNTKTKEEDGNEWGGGGGIQAEMKNAVTMLHRETIAHARISAVRRGDYAFERVEGGSGIDGGGVVLGVAQTHEARGDGEDGSAELNEALVRTPHMVSFSKGVEGRGRFIEQVEIFSMAAVKVVLEGLSVYGKFSLVEHAMSPNLFWSLVYHSSHENEANESETRLSSVEGMFDKALPQLDWSHLLGGRERCLSEKAKENLEQERQSKGAAQALAKGYLYKSRDLAARVFDVFELGLAERGEMMPNESNSYQVFNERERRARAAMARSGNGNVPNVSLAAKPANLKNEWILNTPLEKDLDELIQCMQEEDCEETTIETWAQTLLNNVPNWRVLANSNPEDILSKLSVGKVSSLPSRETVDMWINAAQEQSMNEIMDEILDFDGHAKEALSDYAHSSTPIDLVMWEHSPKLLLDAVLGYEAPHEEWTVVNVIRWISRAKTAVDTCTWLESFL